MIDKRAETAVPINELLARRWSGRAFDPDRPLEREQILALVEAARWSPSCFGDEPWRYILCNRRGKPDAWENAFVCLNEANQAWAKDAPLLILAVACTRFTRNGKPNRWAQYDTGAASMSMAVQATELGLMMHQMGGFSSEATMERFTIPPEHDPVAMIAVGYQLPEDAVPDELRDREFAARHRVPLGDRFFDGGWDVPLT